MQDSFEPGAEEFSEVLGYIYDAVLEPELWPAAIEASCGFLRCGAAAIASVDILHLGAVTLTAWGYQPPYLEGLAATARVNPAMRASFQFKIGEVGSLVDAMSMEEFHASDVYKHWAKPQGIVDVMQVMLDRTATSAVVIGCARFERDGLVDDRARHRLRLLAPHLRRAVLIGRSLELNGAQAAAFADTIDGLAAAVFLVGHDAELIYVNASGEVMLAARDFLYRGDGALRARDARADRILREHIQAAASGDSRLHAQGEAMSLIARTGERFAANVLSLSSGRRRHTAAQFSAVAAIFVRSTAVAFPQPIRMVSEVHDLTPGETRVLFLILEVHGVSATATMLGVSEATVKTHLRGIFRKTGTRNQAELVKLVAGYASPLA